MQSHDDALPPCCLVIRILFPIVVISWVLPVPFSLLSPQLAESFLSLNRKILLAGWSSFSVSESREIFMAGWPGPTLLFHHIPLLEKSDVVEPIRETGNPGIWCCWCEKLQAASCVVCATKPHCCWENCWVRSRVAIVPSLAYCSSSWSLSKAYLLCVWHLVPCPDFASSSLPTVDCKKKGSILQCSYIFQ